MKKIKHNILQLLISLDQALHCLLGLLLNYTIYADETFSSFQYRRNMKGKKWIKICIDSFFSLLFSQEEHCKKAYLSERENRHLPPEMRDTL